jgi:hypothetical protein
MKRSSDPSMDGLLELPEDFPGPFARSARVSRGRLIIELTVGITVIVPLSHLPGFAELPPRAFKDPEIIGGGIGVHFPEIDADISIENLFVPREKLLFSRIPPKLIDRRPRPVNTPGW